MRRVAALLKRNAANVIQIMILLAIAYQGYMLYAQFALTRNTAIFSVMQGLRQGIAEMEDSVYQDPTGRFAEAQEGNCALAKPPFAVTEELIVTHIIGFYELYHDAAKLLPPSAVDWRGVCESAHSFINANCLVRVIWNEEFSKIAPPAFRESFRTCTL